ncbi:hypothetical protein BDM02DRAFT_1359055 [Thelephora ganbajun]|uniref:Uncharacterized protein n=1 Tax=Thelephora ganbajun TaxID=370292 RepID=A0ACB6Z2I1_THEGA|nr:hypothetical protein BDM02DRAFT_1359055 [Thelephora ganbajun]
MWIHELYFRATAVKATGSASGIWDWDRYSRVSPRLPPPGENSTDIREGEGRVPEREYENTALTTTTILSVPKEAVHESSPLGPLKAVLGTIAVGYATHQETVAIGNKIQALLFVTSNCIGRTFLFMSG